MGQSALAEAEKPPYTLRFRRPKRSLAYFARLSTVRSRTIFDRSAKGISPSPTVMELLLEDRKCLS